MPLKLTASSLESSLLFEEKKLPYAKRPFLQNLRSQLLRPRTAIYALYISFATYTLILDIGNHFLSKDRVKNTALSKGKMEKVEA